MNLSLEQKVGQVFMFGFPSGDPEGARELVEDLHAGGIIYFARNLDTVEQAAALSETLQGWALSSPPGLPLLISIDQEGGIVARLTKGIPIMPGPMSLAAGSMGLARSDVSRVHEATGIQLRAAGVNMNLAPDLDVNDNPNNPVIGVRSFGQDPEVVAQLGVDAIEGLLSAGVIPVGKHFPGHGNTSVDSHFGLPVLPHPMKRLDRMELVPFRAAVAAGIPAIMTAHIVFQAIDPELPATLSRKVLQGLLREKLGFQGLILTDCMEMDAIGKSPGTVRGAVMALKAGADMVLVSHTRELQVAAYRAVLAAVRSGELAESRLDEAVQRILAAKQSFGVPNPLPSREATRREFWTLSRESHLASITVVKDEANLLPLRKISVKPRVAEQCTQSPSSSSPSTIGEPLRVLLVYAKGSGETDTLSPLGQGLAKEGVAISEVYLEPIGQRDDSDPTGRMDIGRLTGLQENSGSTGGHDIAELASWREDRALTGPRDTGDSGGQRGTNILLGPENDSDVSNQQSVSNQTRRQSNTVPTDQRDAGCPIEQENDVLRQLARAAEQLTRATDAATLAHVVIILTRNAATDEAQAHRAAALVRAVTSIEPAVSASDMASDTVPDTLPLVTGASGGALSTMGLSATLSGSAAKTNTAPGTADALALRPAPCILVATGNPHDLKVVPGVGTYICTYSQRPEAMVALAEILLGHRKPVGRAPVDIQTGVWDRLD